MNQIASLFLFFLCIGSITSCIGQIENPDKPSNIVTKQKTAQELRQEARAKRLAERNKTYNFATLNGKKIHYRDEGTGPTLILIHGMGSNLKQWNHYNDYFKENYRVLSMDLPGARFGQSEALFAFASTDSLAYFVTMLMDELKIEKAHVAGSSFGGATAIQMAALYPERVNKLILIAAAQAMSPIVKEIKAPTLIMWGEKDPILPLEQAHSLNSNIPGSKLKIYKDGPHVPTDSHAEETIADIDAFLSER